MAMKRTIRSMEGPGIRKLRPAMAAPKAARTGWEENGLRPTIDYPQEGEMVYPGHYAVRIGAPGAEAVELSINEGPWLECRKSVGYFWHDWDAGHFGGCSLIARAKVRDKWARSASRVCVVASPAPI